MWEKRVRMGGLPVRGSSGKLCWLFAGRSFCLVLRRTPPRFLWPSVLRRPFMSRPKLGKLRDRWQLQRGVINLRKMEWNKFRRGKLKWTQKFPERVVWIRGEDRSQSFWAFLCWGWASDDNLETIITIQERELMLVRDCNYISGRRGCQFQWWKGVTTWGIILLYLKSFL